MKKITRSMSVSYVHAVVYNLKTRTVETLENVPVIDEEVNEKNVRTAINFEYPFDSYKLIDFTFSHKVTGKCVMSAYELYSRSFQIDE